MARYVIGDIQGCYEGLSRLLDKVKFDPARDTPYAVGYLIPRGEESLSHNRPQPSKGNRQIEGLRGGTRVCGHVVSFSRAVR